MTVLRSLEHYAKILDVKCFTQMFMRDSLISHVRLNITQLILVIYTKKVDTGFVIWQKVLWLLPRQKYQDLIWSDGYLSPFRVSVLSRQSKLKYDMGMI